MIGANPQPDAATKKYYPDTNSARMINLNVETPKNRTYCPEV